MNAIPTTYRGVNFRSRLEARWAAMFDLLGWSWEYEPIDLAGYIPDFVLDGVLLVEVKPLFWRARREPVAVQVAQKIDASGWEGPSALVGARLVFDDGAAVGLSRLPGTPGDRWRGLHVDEYGGCSFVGGSFSGRFCRELGVSERWDLVKHSWRVSGNSVQWRAPVSPERRRAILNAAFKKKAVRR